MDVCLSHHQSPSEALAASRFQQALSLLRQASEYAEQTSGDPWEYAVRIRQLRGLGLSENDLRFLVRLEYVDHAHEVTVLTTDGRQFRSTGDLSFTKRTCFVLTPKGITAVPGLTGELPNGYVEQDADIHVVHLEAPTADAKVPVWDAGGRILSCGAKIVKQFKWRAVNQELVLTAFQEENWPMRIYDPLVPHPSLDVKRRLSDTIKCLNRGQINELLHFRGDGTGEGIVWGFVNPCRA